MQSIDHHFAAQVRISGGVFPEHIREKDYLANVSVEQSV